MCLDTGHVSYCDGDNLQLIQDYPERIGYVHLKQVDPARDGQGPRRGHRLRRGRQARRDVRAALDGLPEMAPILDALARLEHVELFAIVEQDLYPCAADVPLPIATRTLRLPPLRRPARPEHPPERNHPMPSTTPLRVGVIGVGLMGADHAERLAERIANARLVAVSDPDRERAEPLAARFDGVPVHRRPARPGRGPRRRRRGHRLPGLRARGAGAGLPGQHGKPVLCEKPLTMDAESSLRLVEAERRAGRPAGAGRVHAALRPRVRRHEGRCSTPASSAGCCWCTTCTATRRSPTASARR